MSTEITNTIKSIYNTWLSYYRGKQNKPYRFKKDFKNFEKTKNYIYCQKLENLFDNNTEVDLNEFFNAPYEVYSNDEEGYDLKFYTTRKAIKVYNVYKQIKQKD